MPDHILIVGGTRGVGRALALTLAKRGAKIAITFQKNERDRDETLAALDEHGNKPLVFQGDAADPAHARAVAQALKEAWPRLDGLAYCAGLNQMYPLALIDDDDWDAVFRTNVKGAFVFAKQAAKRMISQKRGSIVFFGSFASERFVEGPVHYAAAKSALRGLTESLALEVGRYQVRVNLIAPGVLDGGISSQLPQHRLQDYLEHTPLRRVGKANEVAEAARFLLSDDASFVTGAKLHLDGGI